MAIFKFVSFGPSLNLSDQVWICKIVLGKQRLWSNVPPFTPHVWLSCFYQLIESIAKGAATLFLLRHVCLFKCHVILTIQSLNFCPNKDVLVLKREKYSG